ncbi:unnamed protein product [Gadus morhua 'NCC']
MGLQVQYSASGCLTMMLGLRQSQLLDYGIEEITILLNHFDVTLKKGGCDFNKVQDEWQALKVIVANTFSDKSYLALWQTLLNKEPYNHDFENILHLVEIMLLLPISSAQLILMIRMVYVYVKALHNKQTGLIACEVVGTLQ